MADVSAWQYYDQGGYIGLAMYDGTVVDDFGGGTISGEMNLMSSISSFGQQALDWLGSLFAGDTTADQSTKSTGNGVDFSSRKATTKTAPQADMWSTRIPAVQDQSQSGPTGSNRISLAPASRVDYYAGLGTTLDGADPAVLSPWTSITWMVQQAWNWIRGLFLGQENAVAEPSVQAVVPEGQIYRNYIYSGGQRVALREYTASTNTVYYLLGDHLGSISVVANADGSLHSKQLYKPWGETRYTEGTLPTDYQFTGQRNEGSIGLYYYGARWYDPVLGRFVQADTIVPGMGNPLAWDRYAYVLNNPLLYIDPSGNIACSDAYDFCRQMAFDGTITVSILRRALGRFNVKLSGNWDLEHAKAVYFGVDIVGNKLASAQGNSESSSSAFNAVYDKGVNFIWDTNCPNCRSGTNEITGKACGNDFSSPGCAAGGGFTAGNTITFASMSGQNVNNMARMTKNVVHELGHSYYYAIGAPPLGAGLSRNALRDNENGRLDWQQHPPSLNEGNQDMAGELFADTFIAWSYNAWNTDVDFSKDVSDAQKAMNGLVPRP